MIAYPTTLPCPRIKSHSVSFENDMINSNFDYASTQTHIQKDTKQFNLSIVLNQSQMDTFKVFYTALYDGVSPFTADWLILNDVTTKTIRFTSEYKFKSLGASLYDLTINCEVL